MPLKIAYPYELIETAEVLLSRAWALKPFRKVAEHPAFDFSFEVSQSDDGRRLLITAYYKALRDHVTPAEMASYEARLKDARKALGYRLFKSTQPKATGSGLSAWLARYGMGLFVLVLLPLWAWFYTATRHARPEHRQVDRRLLVALAAWTLIAGGLLLPDLELRIRLPALAGDPFWRRRLKPATSRAVTSNP